MWDWINCHLAGRHEFVVRTTPNQVCLRCLRCGRRSNGWQVAGDSHEHERDGADAKGNHRLLAGALSLLGLSLAHR